MAKIKLIESLRSIKRMTVRYNGLKIRLLLTGSTCITLKSIRQLIVVIFPLKDISKPPPFFFREVLNYYYLSNAIGIQPFHFFGLQMGHSTFNEVNPRASILTIA